MIKKWISLCFLLMGILSLFSCNFNVGSFKGKSVKLQYKYKGDILKYKLTTISKGTITMTELSTEGSSTPPVKVETKTECVFTQKVIGIDEGGAANIEISYDSFEQDIKPSIFGRKEENPFFNFIPGQKFNIKVAKDGFLLEINGIEEIFNTILTKIHENYPDEVIREFKKEFEKNMIMGIKETYQRFPLEEMKVSDSWVREIDYQIPFLGTARVKYSYTIEEFKQIKGLECVKLRIDTMMNLSEITPELFLQQLNMPQVEVKFKGNSQGKGKMIFAYQEGKLINTDLGMNMNMQISDGEKEIAKMDFDTQILVELQ